VIQLNLLLSSVLFGGVYALFAVGLSLLLGVMRIFNVAHGAVFTIAALSTIEIAKATGWTWIPLILIGAGIGFLLGVPIEVLAVLPFRRSQLLREDMENGTMLATLALLYIANALTTHYTQASLWTYPYGTFPTDIVRLGSIGLNVIYYINFGVAIVLIAVLALVINRTQLGRAVRAIASDYRSARLLGINVGRFSLGLTCTASMLAGTAGVLLGMAFNAVQWDFGDTFLFQGFVIVVLGGVGSILGTLIAAMLMSSVETFTAYYAGGSWSEAIAFGLLMLFLVVRPQGILGRVEAVRA
jgi:branched-chain amino acid transport system permease protein